MLEEQAITATISKKPSNHISQGSDQIFIFPQDKHQNPAPLTSALTVLFDFTCDPQRCARSVFKRKRAHIELSQHKPVPTSPKREALLANKSSLHTLITLMLHVLSLKEFLMHTVRLKYASIM